MTPKRTARALPKITVEEVLAFLEDVDRISREARRQARDVLATVIEPIVLKPTPEGYEAEIRLKSRTAALASRRPVFDAMSCGGAMINFLSSADTTDSALIVPIRGRIHPKSIVRGLRGALPSA